MLHHVSVLENFRRLGGNCLLSSPHCHLPSESKDFISGNSSHSSTHAINSKYLGRCLKINMKNTKVQDTYFNTKCIYTNQSLSFMHLVGFGHEFAIAGWQNLPTYVVTVASWRWYVDRIWCLPLWTARAYPPPTKYRAILYHIKTVSKNWRVECHRQQA